MSEERENRLLVRRAKGLGLREKCLMKSLEVQQAAYKIAPGAYIRCIHLQHRTGKGGSTYTAHVTLRFQERELSLTGHGKTEKEAALMALKRRDAQRYLIPTSSEELPW